MSTSFNMLEDFTDESFDPVKNLFTVTLSNCPQNNNPIQEVCKAVFDLKIEILCLNNSVEPRNVMSFMD